MRETLHIKVPELRFPEFSGEWEEKRLGEIGKTRNGLTYSPSDVTTEAEGILVARSSNIQEGMPHFEDCVFVSMEVPEQSVLRENDILTPRQSHKVGTSGFTCHL